VCYLNLAHLNKKNYNFKVYDLLPLSKNLLIFANYLLTYGIGFDGTI